MPPVFDSAANKEKITAITLMNQFYRLFNALILIHKYFPPRLPWRYNSAMRFRRQLVAAICLVLPLAFPAESRTKKSFLEYFAASRNKNWYTDSRSEKLAKMRLLEKDLQENISRVRNQQPNWDPEPVEGVLQKSIESFEKTGYGWHKDLRTLPWFACQSPLLDMQLFKSAVAFSKHVGEGWAMSGNDFSPLLPYVESANHELEQKLIKYRTSDNVDLIRELSTLLGRAAEDFACGDTDKAKTDYLKMISKVEATDNYQLTSDILTCYQQFLRAICYRPSNEHNAKYPGSISSELDCLKSDIQLSSALKIMNSSISDAALNNLKILHRAAAKLRREGNLDQAEEKYKELVAAADATGDKTSAIQYYALNAYCGFLTGYYSRRTDAHQPLFCRRTKLAVAEELGKQKRLEQGNITRGGDWLKLEQVFQKLKRKNIVVIRSSKTYISNSPPLSEQNELAKSRLVSGLVYYSDEEPAPIEILEDGKLIHKQTIRLGCQGRLERSKCSHCRHKHIKENSKANTKKQLLEALKDAGLEAQDTINSANSIEVVGDWSNHSP